MGFALPEEERALSSHGVVRWKRQGLFGRDGAYQLGIEFADLDDTTRFCLQAFVNDRLQQSVRLRSVRGPFAKAIQTRFMKVLWLLVGGGLFLWIAALQRQGFELRKTLAERAVTVQQLEVVKHKLQAELREAKAKASHNLDEIDRLRLQTAQLETEVDWLSQNLAELTRVYSRIRDEREKLRDHVAQLEQRQAALESRLSSIPELRLAMREAIRSRRSRLRQGRTQRIERLREIDRYDLQQGNRGYIIHNGFPTLTLERVSIHVHSPEPTP